MLNVGQALWSGTERHGPGGRLMGRGFRMGLLLSYRLRRNCFLHHIVSTSSTTGNILPVLSRSLELLGFGVPVAGQQWAMESRPPLPFLFYGEGHLIEKQRHAV